MRHLVHYFYNTAACSTSASSVFFYESPTLTVAIISQDFVLHLYFITNTLPGKSNCANHSYIYMLTSPEYVTPFPKLQIHIPNFLWTSISGTLAWSRKKYPPVIVRAYYPAYCYGIIILSGKRINTIVLTISHE